MPPHLTWTEAADTQLRRLRAEGASWDAIAAALGVSRYSAIERGRRIGAPRPRRSEAPAAEDRDREPLPPGHPRSWTALTVGTALEGQPYPFPVFLR